jgi:hypothetical protein
MSDIDKRELDAHITREPDAPAMPWYATHRLHTRDGAGSIDVMLMSDTGEAFTKQEWDNSYEPGYRRHQDGEWVDEGGHTFMGVVEMLPVPGQRQGDDTDELPDIHRFILNLYPCQEAARHHANVLNSGRYHTAGFRPYSPARVLYTEAGGTAEAWVLLHEGTNRREMLRQLVLAWPNILYDVAFA